jgi:uncharacterized damage-inducible protein DinB
MIAEAARAADQLRRSYHGEAWHGPSLSELLSRVTAEHAATHPIPNAHSIHEIVEHISFWESRTLEALRGSPMPAEDNDWPAPRSWDSSLAQLRKVTDELVAAIETFPLTRIEDIVPGRDYPFAFLMHGIVQHNLYHAGQIAVLNKAFT